MTPWSSGRSVRMEGLAALALLIRPWHATLTLSNKAFLWISAPLLPEHAKCHVLGEINR